MLADFCRLTLSEACKEDLNVRLGALEATAEEMNAKLEAASTEFRDRLDASQSSVQDAMEVARVAHERKVDAEQRAEQLLDRIRELEAALNKSQDTSVRPYTFPHSEMSFHASVIVGGVKHGH